MSLVAYGASDSENSDDDSSEENTANTPNQESLDSKHAEDGPSENNSLDSGIGVQIQSPPPVTNPSHNSDTSHVQDLLKELPAPVSRSTAVDEAADELEEVVKPKWSQIKDAPKPPKPKSVKQPVRITIPSLSYDSDEEEEPAKKKPKASSVKCGLTALLPCPVHMAKKEANRILIPYSMTRKKTETSQNSNKPKNATVSVSSVKPSSSNFVSGFDSDSDDDSPVNFFSLDSDDRKSPPREPSYSVGPVSLGNSSDFVGPTAPVIHEKRVGRLDLPAPRLENMDSTVASSSGVSTFSSSAIGVDGIHFDAGPVNSTTSFRGDNYAQTKNRLRVLYYSCTVTLLADYMYVFQFLRLQGRQKRGREEINFVDVNADDFISTVDVQKNMSVEQKDFSHRKKATCRPHSSAERSKSHIWLTRRKNGSWI
ncbi:hypothetical protein ScPMuIL_017411 [Solemya velum]